LFGIELLINFDFEFKFSLYCRAARAFVAVTWSSATHQIATTMSDGSIDVWNSLDIASGPVVNIPADILLAEDEIVPDFANATGKKKDREGRGRRGRRDGRDGRNGSFSGGQEKRRGSRHARDSIDDMEVDDIPICKYCASSPHLLFVASAHSVKIFNTSNASKKLVGDSVVTVAKICAFDVSMDGSRVVVVSTTKKFAATQITMLRVVKQEDGRKARFEMLWSTTSHIAGKQLWDVTLSQVSVFFSSLFCLFYFILFYFILFFWLVCLLNFFWFH
jgi:hypothetical protein